MHVSLIGGTGDIGQALALRLDRDTDTSVTIGSRDEEKADRKAAEYASELRERGTEPTVDGTDNATAASVGDVVVLTVPPYFLTNTLDAIESGLDEETVLVSPAVGISGGETMNYDPPSVGSVAELVADHAPSGVPVVGAFTNLSAERLSDLDEELDLDTLVFGDDAEAKVLVSRLTDAMDGIRAVDAGPLANAAEVEALTPLLIEIAKHNADISHAGVEFV